MLKCSWFVFFLALLLPPHLAGAETFSGPVAVVDGDSLRIDGRSVRLHGIDAPEQDQTCTDAQGAAWPCGVWVQAQLRAMAEGQSATCTQRDTDRYGRIVARCSVGGEDLGVWLVSGGMARAYRRYSLSYVPAEIAARRSGRGLWAGEWDAPEAYRRGETVQAACAIKGNISANGRLYHLPGSRTYAATRIDETRGERWFCSEAEALRAGWRRAGG